MYYQHTEHSAEGEAENSQAKGPDFDETLESKGAPKKEIFQVDKTEAHRGQNVNSDFDTPFLYTLHFKNSQ